MPAYCIAKLVFGNMLDPNWTFVCVIVEHTPYLTQKHIKLLEKYLREQNTLAYCNKA
jgi:hypothetical protein